MDDKLVDKIWRFIRVGLGNDIICETQHINVNSKLMSFSSNIGAKNVLSRAHLNT